jgi:outer membrane lipoprotein SlyB
MAENNDRNRNGVADRNAANMSDGDAADAAGIIGGGVLGAAAGSAFGPIGTVAGAIAGAVLVNQAAGDGVGFATNDVQSEPSAAGVVDATNRAEQNKET